MSPRLATLSLALAAMSCPQSPSTGAAPAKPEAQVRLVNVVGSETLLELTKRWAYAFNTEHPQVRVQVKGGGSGKGLAALIEGTADVAMSSRPIKKEEAAKVKEKHGVDALEVPVALDGVAFFVNEENPVKVLTPVQLKDVFSGKVTSWQELGGPAAPITVFTSGTSSGTHGFVKELLLRDVGFSPTATEKGDTADMVDAVSRARWSIGFGGAAFAKGVTTVGVRSDGDVVIPTVETVRAHTYPMSRKLYFYVAGVPGPDAKAFLDYVQTAPAQAEAVKEGFYALK